MLQASPTAADTPQFRPFANVPQQHWTYDAVHSLAQDGIFTGYPDDMFTGKRPVTRYEFAVALQRMVAEVQGRHARGLVLAQPLRLSLAKLTQEFSPELAMLGADLAILRKNLLTLTFPWRGDAPDLATCSPTTYPGVGTPEDAEYLRGHQFAVQEWQRGDVVFYVAPASASPRISAATGVLYRVLDTRGDEPLLAGHNAEVRRRLEQFGSPASAHPGWIEAALHPERPWAAGPPPLRLDTQRREATSPDGQVLLRLEEGRPGMALLLRVTTPERTRALPLPGFDLSCDTLEVYNSAGAALLHLAVRRPEAEQVYIRVVELKSGTTLHQLNLPAATLRPTPARRVPTLYPYHDESK